jgi:hypothetical protein
MTAAVPFPLPPGRALSAWRRELAAFAPRRLWLAHLLLHRVEALVRVAGPPAMDPFQAALLRQLSDGATPERLGVERDVMGRWLHDLAAAGLTEAAGGVWRLTERGRRALDSGGCTAAVEERRVFTFLEENDARHAQTFLPFHGPALGLASPPDWRFDAATLEACVRRPAEWKARHGFPLDVEAVVATAGPEARAALDWRRVILDRPEQVLLVFQPSGAVQPPQWLGFAAGPQGWTLQTGAPALTLPLEAGLREVLPDLGEEPSSGAWQESWRGWGLGRGLAAHDAEACRVAPLEDRLRVTGPHGLAQRLGGERNDAWLLAGVGRVRVAAPMDIVEEG